MTRANMLIVDDEASICDLLSEEFTERGYNCVKALDASSALQQMRSGHYHVVLLDIRLPGTSGIELLKTIKGNHADAEVIMITATNDLDTAVATMKMGASDYIVKPFDLQRVALSVSHALEGSKLPRNEFAELDAIAEGVEEKQNSVDSHSLIVTQATAEIAQQLGIPGVRIRNWVTARERGSRERKKRIKTGVHKLLHTLQRHDPLDLSEAYRFENTPGEHKN